MDGKRTTRKCRVWWIVGHFTEGCRRVGGMMLGPIRNVKCEVMSWGLPYRYHFEAETFDFDSEEV